mmetsp:Transcript_16925/g.27177  ORF Transcript_16925/g.27177 Transcript_16925/m.27177 type:complete len:82 (-) Transcript_16925:384-629(-)
MDMARLFTALQSHHGTVFVFSTAHPSCGDIFEGCFKAQRWKLKRLFCKVSVKKDVRALSFELGMSSRKCHRKCDRLYNTQL